MFFDVFLSFEDCIFGPFPDGHFHVLGVNLGSSFHGLGVSTLLDRGAAGKHFLLVCGLLLTCSADSFLCHAETCISHSLIGWFLGLFLVPWRVLLVSSCLYL